MMNLGKFEVLNSKSAKEVSNLLRQQWGYEEKPDCGFLRKENDIFLITKDIGKIDLGALNVNSIGLYFGELRHEQLRLSIEGSQIVGKKAKKNVAEIGGTQLKRWLSGEDLEATGTSCEDNSYAIIKHGSDFFGCGRIKEGKLLNFVPKARRLLI